MWQLLVITSLLEETGISFTAAVDHTTVSKSDVAGIICDLCTQLVLEGIDQTEIMRSKNNGNLQELQVNEMVERICDPRAEEGEWLTHLDIYSSSSGSINPNDEVGVVVGSWQHGFETQFVSGSEYLLLFEHKYPGWCEEECNTVTLGCHQLLDSINVDRLAVSDRDLNAKSAITYSASLILDVVCTY
jgi:hypothetical protein